MKKLFTFLLLGCAAVASAQQLPNSSFKEWKGEGNCGKSLQSPSTKLQRPGDEPASWNGSNVNQYDGLATEDGYVTKGTGQDGSTCVKLTNLPVGAFGITANAPAYITFGTPWVYPTFPVANSDGGTYGGTAFDFRPDAIKGQYKRTPATTAENAHIIVYLWKGTFTSTVSGNATLDDVDRAILGKTEATTSGTLIASCDYEFATTTNNDWQEIIVPLEYVEGQENTIPEKMNVIISSADYWTRGNIQENSILEVDNVEFVYYSQLQSLSYDGTAVEKFNKNTYEYSIDATYDKSKLEAKADGVGATVEQKYDKATGKLTITVKGNDWKENPLNQHVYTIQFAVTKDYKNDLSVGINGQYTEPQETTIQLIEQVDGTYSFVLKNFYFTTVPVGNIQLDDLTLTDSKISATQGIAITNGDDPNVKWAGPGLTMMAGGSIPVELEATVYDNENMTAEIAIDMTSTMLGQMINVAFAPSFTLNSSTSIGEGTSNLYNVEFNRSFPAGWSTICLPFATTVEALGATQAQEFTAFANNTLEFTKVSTGKLEANTPYLIHFEQAKDLSAAPIYAPMTVENSTPKAVTFGDVTFTGNYTAGMSMKGYYGVADQNGSQYIMKGGSNSTLGSTGAYFSVAGAAAEVNRLALDLEGVTAIGSVETEGAEDAFDVYSISGVKVRTGATNLDGLQRGLYIVNGKKVLVK